MPDPSVSLTSATIRVRVFVDFWNFQLSVNRAMGNDFRIDWKRLGPRLTKEIEDIFWQTASGGRVQFDGMHVYLSYNASTERGRGLKNWALNVLDRFPGIQVVAKPRKRKHPPRCPACGAVIDECPVCGKSTEGTVEKGVDTAMVTDMIRLAWEDAYDVAILVSSDADFIPAVQFLDSKGRRVIQGGFPPKGMDLARTCWASIDMFGMLRDLARF